MRARRRAERPAGCSSGPGHACSPGFPDVSVNMFPALRADVNQYYARGGSRAFADFLKRNRSKPFSLSRRAFKPKRSSTRSTVLLVFLVVRSPFRFPNAHNNCRCRSRSEADLASTRIPGRADRRPQPRGLTFRHMTAAAKPRWQVASPKCVVCDKSVYEIEKLVADERVFHKTCFKCGHCSKTLSLGNYASINEKTYCKPHFKQLFAEKAGTTARRSGSAIERPRTRRNRGTTGRRMRRRSPPPRRNPTPPRTRRRNPASARRRAPRRRGSEDRKARVLCATRPRTRWRAWTWTARASQRVFQVRRVRRAPLAHHVRQARLEPVLQAGRPEAGRQGGSERPWRLPWRRRGWRPARRARDGGEARQRGAGQGLAPPRRRRRRKRRRRVASPEVAVQTGGVASEAEARTDDTREAAGEGGDARESPASPQERARAGARASQLPPGSPEALLEAELAQVVGETLDVAEEITGIIDDVEEGCRRRRAGGGRRRR